MRKNNKNKIIIIGEKESGKTCEAMRIAITNKGTTVFTSKELIDEVEKKYNYGYPLNKKSFHLKSKRIFYCHRANEKFGIMPKTKYFVEYRKEKYLCQSYYSPEEADGTKFINELIFGCSWGNLQDDQSAMVIFDGTWTYQENPLLRLWQFYLMNCQIVITVKSWEELLGLPKEQITQQMIDDIYDKWQVQVCRAETLLLG